jgi:hypothetical protein
MIALVSSGLLVISLVGVLVIAIAWVLTALIRALLVISLVSVLTIAVALVVLALRGPLVITIFVLVLAPRCPWVRPAPVDTSRILVAAPWVIVFSPAPASRRRWGFPACKGRCSPDGR